MVMLPPHKVQAPAVPTVSPEPPTPTQPAPPPVLQHLFPGRPAPAAVARNAVQPAAVLHQMLPLASPPRAEVAAQPQPRLAAGSGPRRPKAAPVPQSFLCPITQASQGLHNFLMTLPPPLLRCLSMLPAP